MDWHEVCTYPTDQFISWLDRQHRVPVIEQLLRRRQRLSELDAHEAWSMMITYAWKNGRRAQDFNDQNHVRPWCIVRCATMLSWMWTNERQRRGHRTKMDRAVEILISELQTEQYQAIMANLSNRSTQPDIGPGGQGWLKACLDTLTHKQRRAVEILVLAGQSTTYASEIEPDYPKKGWTSLRNRGVANSKKYIEREQQAIAAQCAVEGRPFRVVQGRVVIMEAA